MSGGSEGFRAVFGRWSRRVRGRLALERALTGAAVGLVLGAGASVVAWQTGHGSARPFPAVAGLLGAGAGVVLARRRRFDDVEVALFLDGKLGSAEAIATAVELDRDGGEGGGGEDPARAVVIARATALLQTSPARAARARVWRRSHGVLPLAAAAIVAVSLAPLPPPPAAPPPPPGSDVLQLAEIAGLEKVIALAELDARDEAQRERLDKLADEARRLREKLRTGVEKREAQADIAKLRDGILGERLSLGEGEQRQGLESALGKMGENGALRDAAKALGDRDLTELDREMERLANQLEREDRDRARKTLEEAAEAAKRAGAPGVAKALEEQKKLLEERGARADKLRELGKALGEGLSPEAREALRDLEKGGAEGPTRDQQKLAERLEDALEKLSPEERRKLAENLKRKIAQSAERDEPGQPPASEQAQKELAEQLATPEGMKQLEDQLRKMAEEPPAGSDEAERERALEDAQRGADEAEGQCGGAPVPIAGGPGAPQPGRGGSGKGKPGEGAGGPPGDVEGGGPGGGKKAGGQTAPVEGEGLRARASTSIGRGRPMPGMVLGRSAGRAGETANVQGEGALGVVGPSEVGGVDRSDVPEEYREQVGRYFQPQ